MSNFRFISASEELASLCGGLAVRAASVLAGGAVTAGLAGARSWCLLVSTAAELGLLAEAALHAGALGDGDAVIAAAELVRVAVAAGVVRAGRWCVPGGKDG